MSNYETSDRHIIYLKSVFGTFFFAMNCSASSSRRTLSFNDQVDRNKISSDSQSAGGAETLGTITAPMHSCPGWNTHTHVSSGETKRGLGSSFTAFISSSSSTAGLEVPISQNPNTEVGAPSNGAAKSEGGATHTDEAGEESKEQKKITFGCPSPHTPLPHKKRVD